MFNRRLSLLFLSAALSGAPIADAAEADGEVPLSFTRLELTDGRKLRNVVVKSYDAKSEKLLVITEGKAMAIPIALLPPPFNEKLKDAPASGGSVSTLTTPPRAMATAADQYVMERPVQIRHVPVMPRPPRSAPLPVEDSGQVFAQHQIAARTWATRHYTFERPVGSNSVRITRLEVQLESTKAVPGWGGRFETQGKVFLEYFDSKGGSFQRTTSDFEVVTEQKPGESVQVATFRIKR